ncbi:CDP-glucose 4,6-dehydratase [Dehalococcoidia bacterium]|nr:CDP-glucose 4,6-dehydratase [Dehalococcoidia bacterium]
MRPFGDLYQGKRVLITGHTGFKGSWLALWLKELGAEVLGYSLEPPTTPNFFEATGLEKAIGSVLGDIRDEGHLISVFHQFKPEFVFHLAAQPLVRLSYEEPQLTYTTNVMGTVNILEAVRKTKSVRVAVMVTSDKCYENKEWIYGYREIDPMGGYDPYSSSKGCAELVIAAYIRSFFSSERYQSHGVAVASVRAGNVIGGGDWGADRLVPDCVRGLSQDEVVVMRHPEAVRPWQYILEPLSGYLWLAARMHTQGPKFGGAWNLGPHEEDMLTVREIVELAISLWGKGTYRIDGADHPHEAKLLKLDCSKAHRSLKWRPAYDVYKAIEETIEWYRRFYSEADGTGGSMHELSVAQINKYVNVAHKKGILWTTGGGMNDAGN